MKMTTADFFTRLLHYVDADDVAPEIEALSAEKRDTVWGLAMDLVERVSDDRVQRLAYVLQVLVAVSKDCETTRRGGTKEALKKVEDSYEGEDRVRIRRVIDQIEHREATMMTFHRYEALATLLKYGNLYKIKDDREFTSWSPKGDDVPLSFTNEETVGWLVGQGLAYSGDYDPALCLGKVLPSAKGRRRLQDHGLTAESPGVGVHLGHCCLKGIHGCKYGDEFCPVTTKMFPPESERCGACYEDDSMTDEALGHYTDDELAHELVSRGYTVTDPENDEDEGDEDAQD